MTTQITPFPVMGMQEQLGGSAQLFSAPGTVLAGPGTLTSLACASGTFQIYDSVGPPVGLKPLISVASVGAFTATPGLAFANGIWVNAQGKNSAIQIGVN
jgi:hypothetical protein